MPRHPRALPDGVELTPDGRLTGVPSKAGYFSFTAKVRSGSHESAKRYVLRVLPTTTELTISTVDVATFVNDPTLIQERQLSAAGGVKPYKWSVDPSGDPLFAGMTLSQDGLLKGSGRSMFAR